MTDINAAVEVFSGQWVPLTKKEHGVIEGRVISFDTRPMTFEGSPVLSRKTGQQRTEWVLTVDTGNGEPVKFDLKESGQRAVAAAIKASGQPAKNGDRIKIAVTKDSVQGKEQADYQVRWTPDSTPLEVPVAAEEEPF